MKKKIASMVMCCIMILQLFAGLELNTSALDEFDPWYGYTAIRTKEDLDAVRNNLNGKYYLANDIVFEESDFMPGGDFYNGGKGWLAIGSEDQPFTGVFDGCNYSIKGLKMTPSDSESITGLFAVNGTFAVIERIVLDSEINMNLTITSNSAQKPCAAVVGINKGIIRNCHVSGSINYTMTKDPSLYSFGDVTHIGAITAQNQGQISRCSSAVDITIKAPISGSPYYFTMKVGGICGTNSDGAVVNCYNSGNISKNEPSVSQTSALDSIGGIVGSNMADIQYCYNTGKIENSGYSSAIVDYYSEFFGRAGDCYFLDNMSIGSRTASEQINAGLIKATSQQMKQKNTYVGWDFDNVWDIVEGKDYPFLRKDLTNLDIEHKAFAAGEGSESNPFVIENAEQFLNISRYLESHFLIANDIEFNEDIVFPSEGLGKVFQGTLDGGNNTISGFTNLPKLFTFNFGTIRNLKLYISDSVELIKSTYDASYIGGLVSSNNSTIENCVVLGDASFEYTGGIRGSYYIGGITGINVGEIINCQNRLNITAPFIEIGSVIVGGITGKNAGLIRNSSNHGDIIVTGYDKISLGGIAGENTIDYIDDSFGSIKQCYNSGDLGAITVGEVNSSDWVRVGGIAAENDAQYSSHKVDIQNCFNIGNITGMNINAEREFPIKLSAGGILAYNASNGKISYCYNSGAVETLAEGLVAPENLCGGLVGENNGSITASVALDLEFPCVGRGASTGATLKTLEQMKSANGFAEFDFSNVWEFRDDIDFNLPILKNTAFSFAKKPVGIKISKKPKKTTYSEDEEFDFSDLKVILLYNNGFCELTDKIEVIWDEIYYGINIVVILYSDDDYFYFLPLEITVNPKPFNRITMETLPNYTSYFVGNSLILDGATVRIHYTDGTSKVIELTKDMVSTVSLNKAGTIPITVNFYGKTTSFNVSVFNKQLISNQYHINRSTEFISNISQNTSVSSFLNGIEPKDFSFILKGSSLMEDSDIVGTGCILAMWDGENILDYAYAIVTGDVNGDGNITLTDYAKLKAHLLEREKLSGVYLKAADINGDGKTTLTDYAKMKAHLLGRETIIPQKY